MSEALKRRDIRIENCGSIMLFNPLTTVGKEWMDENVEADGYQWLGNKLAVEPRYARDLAQGMLDNGLTVA